ncbi:MAG: bifunctional phosphopantothenoylcysteine decarboxylase/phosphopantothenate--cysteine ligase CoaBC, partial [Candidatus Micrarchaeia archaeon]
MHPAKEIAGSSGSELKGRRVCLCVCGSVACYRAVDAARELMRRGAEVFPVLSESAAQMVSPELFQAATGNEAITRLSGELEHIQLVGRKGICDAVLVAPATANTISKLAHGISDSVVSTVLATALASKPIVLAPAAHDALMENPVVKENEERLRALGVVFVPPIEEEGKAKIADAEEIADHVARALTKQSLAGRRVVVTAGATREHFDDVRFISNPSSGRMGVALAREAWLRGASVRLVAGHVDVGVPRYVERVNVTSVEEMRAAVLAEAADYFLIPGAPGDFVPRKKEKGKISSAGGLTLELAPAPKIRADIKRKFPKAKLVLFKAESGVSDDELEKKAS